jgi:hypothetical protein
MERSRVSVTSSLSVLSSDRASFHSDRLIVELIVVSYFLINFYYDIIMDLK